MYGGFESHLPDQASVLQFGSVDFDIPFKSFLAREGLLLNVSCCVAYVCATAKLNTVIVVCEGIPDTLSVLRADIAACGVYGAQGWREAYRAKFRRCERFYVALDRDAVEKTIAFARVFGRRGRVIVPPEELGPNGDLNDWFCHIAKGHPEEFERLLVRP